MQWLKQAKLQRACVYVYVYVCAMMKIFIDIGFVVVVFGGAMDALKRKKRAVCIYMKHAL